MKRFFPILVLFLTVWGWPALAQEPPTLSTLDIALWPEFDQPEVLVIYRGVFASDTPLPLPVEIRIPARVGSPAAVAYVGEGGQRFNQEYTTRADGDWLVVSFELETLGFQLEYYDALSTSESGQREYAYSYVVDYSVDSLSMEFQVPPTAEGFALDPPADSVVTEGDGLVYHRVTAKSVAQGEELARAFAYQKNNEELTVSLFVQPEATAPTAPPAQGGEDNSAVWIFLVAFVALIAVGGGAFWLGQRTQPQPEPPPRRQKRRGSGRGIQPQRQSLGPLNRDESLYCYKCGAELRPDSEFCHKCGAEIRKI